MSNKLKKKIKCYFCNKTVPFTEDCQELFGKDVCPECAVKVAAVVNKIVDEYSDSKEKPGMVSHGGYPVQVELEPEGYYDTDGNLKLTGFGLVKKEEG